MRYVRKTFVPGEVFDVYLPYLSDAEVKLLLVVVRQTNGWVQRDGRGRKVRDWILREQFVGKTGLSAKSVSKAIDHLVLQKLIVASDSDWNPIYLAKSRKGRLKLFYSISSRLKQEQNVASEKSAVVRIDEVL